MPSIYSEQFLGATGAAVETAYWVPPGKRAVIRSVVATCNEPEGAYFWVYLAGMPIYARSFQAQREGVSVDMRQVAYGGQSIKAYTSTASVFVAVAGYLFDDPTLAADAPGEVTRIRVDRTTPLPSEAPAA